MGFGSFLKKGISGISMPAAIIGGLATGGAGAIPAGLLGNNALKLFGSNTKPDGTPYTLEEITKANLYNSLTRAQKQDQFINNPDIITPGGFQKFDPLTNTITLGESDFQKEQRLRQERLAEQLTSSLSGYLPSSNEEIQNATFNRGKALLDPEFQRQRRDLEQQLADQGIPRGSEQYNNALNRLDQSQNRAYTDLSQASIQTAETQRNNRFNEIASLLGTQQIGGQSFQQYQPQYNGLDLFGAEQAQLNRNFSQSQLSRQLSSNNRNAIYGALGGLGAAGIGAFAMSDINLKTNIESLGSENGFNIYSFNYKNDLDTRYKGVMAQEVKEIMPEAVKLVNGYYFVNYDKIGVKMEVLNGSK